MRFLARLAAAFAAALRTVTVLVRESGRWVLKTISSLDPVLPAAVAAEDYLDAAAAAAAGPAADGIRACHPVGVALVMHARHVVDGGQAVDLCGLPAPVAMWLHSLSPDELGVLARTMPHEAEALAAGTGRVPGLPGPNADASAEPVTHPQADADVSAPALSWPHRDNAADRAMADLLAHVEGLRVRRARVA